MRKKDKTCCDCGKKEGSWMVEFSPFFKGSFGKKDGLYCDECFIDNLEWLHCGGGWSVENVIKPWRVNKKKYDKKMKDYYEGKSRD